MLDTIEAIFTDASAKPVVPFSGSSAHAKLLLALPGNVSEADVQAWRNFPERNLGFVLLRRHSPTVVELLDSQVTNGKLQFYHLHVTR